MATEQIKNDASETSLALEALAKGHFGNIPPKLIAEAVTWTTQDADWPVRRAALEALARRYGFAERDHVQIGKRPAGRSPLGIYRVGSRAKRGKSASGKSYELALLGVAPLRVSCACADFVRSSLGLCKHSLVVLDALHKRGALKVPAGKPVTPDRKPKLVWFHQQPLTGPADRLSRLELLGGGKASWPASFQQGRPVARLLRTPETRLHFVAELQQALARGRLDAEPAVVTLLAEERTRAERIAQSVADTKAALGTLRKLRRKLYPYQREGVARFLGAGSLLLADDMGLGKTTQAIAACHALFNIGRVQHGLLVVPAALKSQWKREWDATTTAPLTVVEGGPAERAQLYARRARGFLVIGYEQLLRDFAHVQRFAPEMVVLDEAQRIKNWETKSAAYVKALQPRYRLVLTGTPMENRFPELASIMDFVDDVALEPKWRLLPWHTLSQGDGASGVSGARNLDTLRTRLAPVMLRRIRKEVLSQLPARTDTRVPVEMTEPQRERHDELKRPIASLIELSSRRGLRQPEFLRLMQLLTTQRMICNGLAQLDFETEWPRCVQSGQATPALLNTLFTPKLAALRELVSDVVISQERKAVVFSQWRNMLRLSEWSVRDLLEQAGLRAAFFTGAESSKQRERAIVELHDDPTARVLFLSDAGGVGLNLQRAASCCINLELPWNPAVLEQRIGRIYRLGQTLPIDVYNLVTNEGIESRIAQLVANKRAVFSSLFDGTTDEVRFEGGSSFLDGVKKLVDGAQAPLSVGDGDSDEAELSIEPLEQPRAPAASAQPGQQPASDASTPGFVDVSTALSRLSLSRLPDGGVRIDAPRELAAPLAELFEGFAKSLRGIASPP
ncbi:MAG TPA: DEAD/DEAH box helicase [Polyangiales bacterium]